VSGYIILLLTLPDKTKVSGYIIWCQQRKLAPIEDEEHNDYKALLAVVCKPLVNLSEPYGYIIL
jgi:hypothetical protein